MIFSFYSAITALRAIKHTAHCITSFESVDNTSILYQITIKKTLILNSFIATGALSELQYQWLTGNTYTESLHKENITHSSADIATHCILHTSKVKRSHPLSLLAQLGPTLWVGPNQRSFPSISWSNWLCMTPTMWICLMTEESQRRDNTHISVQFYCSANAYREVLPHSGDEEEPECLHYGRSSPELAALTVYIFLYTLREVCVCVCVLMCVFSPFSPLQLCLKHHRELSAQQGGRDVAIATALRN